jgi:hypothetical protein
MPLVSPQLDDLSFDTIQAMLRDRIPLVAPDWTDHNDSDPGIALIQLFAHLAEQVGYRLNRVPEKSYVEFLKLVGVRLAPAVAARTRMAVVLGKPASTEAFLVPAFQRIDAKGGLSFETDAPLDVLPAQLAALVTARTDLTDINGATDAGPTAAGQTPDAYIVERFALAWDGKTPKLKDMPTDPVPIFHDAAQASHTQLFLGLAFNRSPAAGFKGARASLHLQIEAEEEPDEDASVLVGGAPLSVVNAFPEGAVLTEYHYYRPPEDGSPAGSWRPLTILSDETEAWTRAGTIRFDVPMKIGPIPDAVWAEVEAGLPHPLVGALKTPVADTPAAVPISGWIRVSFSIPPKVRLRSLGFNTVAASHLTTVAGERLGRGDGRPGQTLALGNGNVAAGTLELISRDETRAQPVVLWQEVTDFDAAGPTAPVYVLDAEAGVVLFGDGRRGLVPQATERMIARVYRHGGGTKGEAVTGQVNKPAGFPAAVSAAVNIVPARGGRDAETLDEAKARAPRAFRARGRAVTAEDFRDAACATPGGRIARAAVVALRRPYPLGHLIGGQAAPGLDVTATAAGALSVVVVPDRTGDYPMPTTTELSAVAAHLDTLRLVTTEVHVTTPQYVRLFDLEIRVRAAPGHTVTAIREAIADHLKTRFHVLTGGPDGTGTPFGGGLHHADLVAEVLALAGVTRVETLTCLFDGHTPDSAERPLAWRLERRNPMRLTNCIETATDTDRIVMLPDEVPFIDPTTLTVSVVGAP